MNSKPDSAHLQSVPAIKVVNLCRVSNEDFSSVEMTRLCIFTLLDICNKGMKPNIKIRKVQTQDLDFVYKAICELENEVLDFDVFKEIFNENISNPNNVYLIAENENEDLGFISFHTQKLLHHCGLVGEIQEFFIHQNYRGKGIGKQLINEIMLYADQNNLKSIEVTTNKRRAENVLIYENLGFGLTHNKFTIYK